jgi:hypothetical protein
MVWAVVEEFFASRVRVPPPKVRGEPALKIPVVVLL